MKPRYNLLLGIGLLIIGITCFAAIHPNLIEMGYHENGIGIKK